jgi:hypothetical protein
LYLLRRARHRARALGLEFDLTESDIIVPAACPVLGIPIRVVQGQGKRPHDSSPSLDRIDPKRGYVRGNVAVLSQRANRIKNDASAEEIGRLAKWMGVALCPPVQ